MLALPLVLAGCGMPIGVTIASFLADAFSLATTDKTLTDHGISAVTGEDCALWRVVKGEKVCSPETGGEPVQVADAGTEGTDAVEPAAETDKAPSAALAADAEIPPVAEPEGATMAVNATPPDAETSSAVAEAPPIAAEPLPVVSESPLPAAEASEPAEPVEPGPLAEAVPPPPPPSAPEIATADESVSLPPAVETTEADESTPPPPEAKIATADAQAPPPMPAPETVTAAEAVPPPPPAAPQPARLMGAATPRIPGGTFLVIASYVRAADAERFAHRQGDLDWRVLSGTAHGKPVFRVAVGPVAPARRAAERGRLVKAGFADAWALHQDHPDVVAAPAVPDQVAELN